MTNKKSYYLIRDFGTKIEVSEGQDYWSVLGYESEEDLIVENGGVRPDIIPISRQEYDEDDGYDVA